MPTANALRIDYPLLTVASIFKTDKQINILGNNGQTLKKFDEDGLYFAEPQFLMFLILTGFRAIKKRH